MIHLDTHVVVWLASGDLARIPDTTLELVECEDVGVSPMVRLELAYLHEIGRIAHAATAVLDELRRSIGLVEDATSFADVVDHASAITWTRDPFDRVIVAQALAAGCRLATADRAIAAACGALVTWG